MLVKKSATVVDDSGLYVFRSASNPAIRQQAIMRCPQIEISISVRKKLSITHSQQTRVDNGACTELR